MFPVASQVKAAVGIKVISPPPVLNKVGTVIVLIVPAPTKFIAFGVGRTKAVIPSVNAAAVVPITFETATVVPVVAPVTAKVLDKVVAPVTPRVVPTVARPDTARLVAVAAPNTGVTIVGLVNSRVLLMLLVVPAWTNGTMSAALMTVATGKPEMATVVIIKSSQRKCCSVDD